MVLTQALGRQARSIGRGSGDGAEIDVERRMDERRWRLDVTRKLEEILARVPYDPSAAADLDRD
ncbi:MAG: hypothetical protein BGO49_17520 [Planctomycetales bacterium 71-10]|nr:MAG: hypothetical protein BGO49_17520 [Planctomycetales bacterium 71-10]